MIIGVVGFIGSGKGTVADILVEKHGFVKLSFADAVKDASLAATSMTATTTATATITCSRKWILLIWVSAILWEVM